MPVATTLVGDIFTLEERGRMQGLFSSVWAISSLVGPAAGGLITDLLSWRWIFYINIPFGIASVAMLVLFLEEEAVGHREHKLDLLGTVLLTASITFLLIGLLEGSESWGWADGKTVGLMVTSVGGLGLFLRQERRAPEPMLPLDLFRSPVIAVASGGSVVIGVLLFTASAYVPMYAQGVLGGTAIDAGLTLAPVSIGWPIASALSGRLLLRIGYRPLTILGGAVAFAGALLLVGLGGAYGRTGLMAAMLVTGVGLGFMATPFIVAVQNAVPWKRRGVATSSQQFFRTIGGAIAVAAFGALMNARLSATTGGMIDPNAVLDPASRALIGVEELAALVAGLDHALHVVYIGFAVIAGAGFLIALSFPAGSAADLAHDTERVDTRTGGRG